MKSVLGNFLLDFNRLLKNILKGFSKRPLPPYLQGILLNKQKNTKYKKSKKKTKKMSRNTCQKNVTFNQRSLFPFI